MRESSCTVVRWKRYGKDRLYVRRPDETDVGWWDLQCEEAHPSSPELLAELLGAVRAWTGGSSAAVAFAPEEPGQPMQPDQPDQPDQPEQAGQAGSGGSGDVLERPWLDLAINRPGEQARERAVAARDAAPVRSRVARVLGVHTEERAWRIGADGEELVAAQLAQVARKDPRWRFLHAIPVGTRGADLDHLAIGPGGVFTLNAKHHPRASIWVGGETFLVDGVKQPYIRNSRHEATRAGRLLSGAVGHDVRVEGLVVPVNAADLVLKAPPAGVHVVARRQVAGWLLRHGDVLDEDRIEQLYGAARRSVTWQP